mgnify:FL=1
MKTKGTRTILITTLILVLVGAGVALAQGGWGYGGHMRGYGGGHMKGYDCPRGGHGPHMGYGGGMRGYGGPGYGSGYGDLSKEDYDKLEAARDKFFDETRELRREMDDKRYAMQQEMAKENPDRDKVKALQGDLSKLRSEFDEKRLEHRLEMREIVPESARGGRGYARNYRGGGGYCW